MQKHLALALLALALAGGVAAFTSINPRPALANPGCSGSGLLNLPPIGATLMKKYLALALLALAIVGGVAAVSTINARPALALPCTGGAC